MGSFHNDFWVNLVLLEFARYFRQNLVVLKFDRWRQYWREDAVIAEL